MPWASFDSDNLKEISGSNGIYEVADAEGAILYIGSAGSKDLFGLRGRIAHHFSAQESNPAIKGNAARFRYEITSSYLSRWVEVLGRYVEGREALPPGNAASDEYIPTLPRFSWKSRRP